MPITINKQRILTHLFTALKKRYEAGAEPEARPVLEQLIYAHLPREGATREQLPTRPSRPCSERFFDWNEIRVSSSRELEEVIRRPARRRAPRRSGSSSPSCRKSSRPRSRSTWKLLQKKGMKQAAKQLARYQAANDYAVAWVMQQALGGHAIPLDGAALRVLRRLGVIEPERTTSKPAGQPRSTWSPRPRAASSSTFRAPSPTTSASKATRAAAAARCTATARRARRCPPGRRGPAAEAEVMNRVRPPSSLLRRAAVEDFRWLSARPSYAIVFAAVCLGSP